MNEPERRTDEDARQRAERTRIEALPSRAALPFTIETAAADEAGRFRVSGVMNSFRATHSGRILHPRGFEAWLKREPGATLPMLANHGFISGGFATIGVWDRFERVQGGMRWSGYLANAVPLATEARALLEQGVLRQLSVGWVTRQARWVTLQDADLEPQIKAALLEGGLVEARVFMDWYPVEGSIVDVADDPAARIAAGLSDPAAVEALAAALARKLRTAEAPRDAESAKEGAGLGASAVASAAVEAALKAVGTLIEGFSSGLENRLAELIEAKLEDLAAAYRLDCGGDTDGAAADEPADRGREAPAATASVDDVLKQVRAKLR